MISRKLLFFLVLLPLLTLLSCTKAEEEAARKLLNIVSEDGFFTLAVPRDIWSEDKEIKITSVPLDQLPEPLRQLRGAGIGYRFEPIGLTFSKPVKATLELSISDLAGWPSDGADAYGLVGLGADGKRKVLSDLETRYTLGKKSLEVSGVFTGLDYVGRTRGSLTARVPSLAELPVAGQMFTASSLWRNSDESGNVTLSGLSAEYSASGAVSLESAGTATGDDLAPGAEFTDRRDFKCDKAGAGAITMRLSATSVVKDMDSVPLRLTLEQPVDCAEEDASEPVIDLPQNLIDYFGLFSIKGADLLNVHYTEDPTNDHIYADPSKTAGFTPGYTDATGFFRAAVNLSQMAATRLTAAYACGSTNNGVQTVCVPGASAFPEGEAYIVGGTLREAFPATTDRTCILANVFNAGTAFKAQPPYLWDFYAGTGTWYEVGSAPSFGWSLNPSRVSDQGVPRQFFVSATRIFIVPDLKVFGAIIPRSDISAATAYRGTADCHNATFDPAESGGDVPGANPTERLLDLPTTWIDVSDICGGRCIPRPPEEGAVIA